MRFNVPDVEIYLNPNIKVSLHEDYEEKTYDSSTKALKYLTSVRKIKPVKKPK